MGQGGCGLAERHCQLSAQKVLQVISFCILSNNNNINRYQTMFTNLHGAKADYSKTKNDQNIHFQMAPRLVLPTARNWSHQHPQRPHVCKYKCHWRWYWWCDYLTIKENPQNAKNVYHFHDLDHQLHHHQASVNQMSGAGRLVQQALGSMLEILKQEVFNATTVRLNLIYIWPKVCTHLFLASWDAIEPRLVSE